MYCEILRMGCRNRKIKAIHFTIKDSHFPKKSTNLRKDLTLLLRFRVVILLQTKRLK